MDNTRINLPESFFHFVWKYRLLTIDLKTIGGEEVRVIHPGTHNQDAGPDFLFARARIAGTLWAGNVEIHKKGSDWFRHGHHKDPGYNNVILHIVDEHDRQAINTDGQEVQTLCIGKKFDPLLIERYRELSENLLWAPCIKQINKVPEIKVLSHVHTMAIERLQQRADGIRNELYSCNMDWEECCYRLISRQFGAKVNIPQFEILTKSLPVRVLMKYHDDLFSIESLLFGQAGMLYEKKAKAYERKLKKEHAYLSVKHRLTPMPGYLWKFLRLRPASFPTLRIAQLAQLYTNKQSLLQEILEKDKLQELIEIFDVQASQYWDTHYIFGKESVQRPKTFGKQSIQLLLINAVIPMLHYYGNQMNMQHLCNRAITFLEELPSEKNAVIRRWNDGGIKSCNALESQGLLHLKNNKCDKRLCLDCGIGLHLLKPQA